MHFQDQIHNRGGDLPREGMTGERCQELLRTSVGLLAKWHLPPTPTFYAIAYEFAAGFNKELTATIENAISGEGLTETHAKEIFERFVAPVYAQATLAGHVSMTGELEAIVNVLGRATESSSQSTHSVQTSIATQIKALNDAKNIDATFLKTVLGRVASFTNSLLEASAGLEEQLSEARKEIDTLHNALVQASIEASTDVLTGVLNRTAFDRIFGTMAESLKEKNACCSILFIDVDHFKKVNDVYGHIAGDRTLRVVGDTIKAKTRGEDIVARYGGEEFVVVLPDTPSHKAYIVAEHIRKSVEGIKVKRGAADAGHSLTISIGIDVLQPGGDAEKAVEQADKALYAAKQGGRNKTVVFV